MRGRAPSAPGSPPQSRCAVIASWVGDQLATLIAAHLLLAVAVILFVEEVGIPLPVPGDLIMLLAGVQVSRGTQSLWAVLAVEEAATLAGAMLLFVVSRRLGRALVARFGRYIGFGPERLAQVEERVRRRAGLAVVAGRLMPGLRIVTVVAAGVVAIPTAAFFPALAVGAFLYLLGYTMIGYFAGPPVLSLFARVAVPVTGILALAGLVVIVLLMRKYRHAERVGPFAEATVGRTMVGGALAAAAGVLTSSAIVGFAGFVTRLTGGAGAFTAEHASQELQVLFGWPLFFTTALVLVAVFAWARLDRLPLPARLLVTAGVPLAGTLLLLDPLTDTSRVGLPAVNTVVLTTVTAIRWTTFALAFEWLPLRRARTPKAQPAGGEPRVPW
jgi:membrane protein DedA with SNARE-associated domain